MFVPCVDLSGKIKRGGLLLVLNVANAFTHIAPMLRYHTEKKITFNDILLSSPPCYRFLIFFLPGYRWIKLCWKRVGVAWIAPFAKDVVKEMTKPGWSCVRTAIFLATSTAWVLLWIKCQLAFGSVNGMELCRGALSGTNLLGWMSRRLFRLIPPPKKKKKQFYILYPIYIRFSFNFFYSECFHFNLKLYNYDLFTLIVPLLLDSSIFIGRKYSL